MNQRSSILLLFSIFLIEVSFCQSTITLRRSFIDSFKNRITISTKYDVWYTHHQANADKDDGDIHCAGYDSKIGLPTIAEIMNAKNEPDAINFLIAHEGMGKLDNKKIEITGIWRLRPGHFISGKETKSIFSSTICFYAENQSSHNYNYC